MNELSLFSGVGGGLLGSKLLGWRTIGYVENESYCQEILKQRIADGILDAGPIFSDVRKFITDGYAGAYRGMVDVLSAGFPCQPFSVAGKGLGEADSRNMWPSTIECVRIIRPRFVFLENVPGLLADKYMGRIFGDLAESGYSFRWTCLGADDVGANHRRKRLWILAYAKENRRHRKAQSEMDGKEMERRRRCGFDDCSEDVANPEGSECEQPGDSRAGRHGFTNGGEEVADTKKLRCGPWRPQSEGQQGESGTSGGSWWSVEPDVGRVAHGVASRVDRLKAIGNGQVPLCMAYAFSKLSEGIIGK